MGEAGAGPRVARIWRGRTAAAGSDAYERYLLGTGIPPLVDTALGVQVLRADDADGSEFVTISYWESVAGMSRFAGEDPRRIHHLPRDAEFLVALPYRVEIFGIIASTAAMPGDNKKNSQILRLS